MKTRLIRFLLNFGVSVVLIIATAEYGGKRLGVVEALERQSYDWRLTRGVEDSPKKQKQIVIVDIDDDSINELGPWPWSRGIFSDLNTQLFDKYNPLAVGYALPFSKPDNTDIRVLNKVEQTLLEDPASYSFSLRQRVGRLREEFAYDQKFADALRGHDVVLGYSFTKFGSVEGALPDKRQFVNAGDKQPISAPIMQAISKEWEFRRGFLGNLRLFMRSATGAGHLGVTLDKDGIVRRAPLFIKHAGGYYASMPMLLLARSQNYADGFSISADTQKLFSLLGAKHVMTEFSIGSYVSGINRDGQGNLRFLGKGGKNVDFNTVRSAVFRYVSIADVIAGDTPKDYLSDKIILIGSSSPALRDLYATPVNPNMPGVELMATQLVNLRDGDILARGAQWREILTLIILLLGLSIVFVFLGPLLSVFVLLAVVGVYVPFVLAAWAENIIWTMVPLLFSVVGLYIFTAISGFAFEWRASRRLQSTFSQYVPPEFAKKMAQAGKTINLEGEGRELTVLFSDVRNFTSISEKLSPHELTLLMNKMLTALTEAIHRQDGTVDKYIGDAVMAFWNAPVDEAEHAKKGVLAAIDMQETMRELSAKLEAEGFKRIELGVGLCTGDASVGNMGSALRMTYTAIGDTVNLASRTEGLTKYYKTPILVTESTYEQCKGDILFRSVDLVQVKGREQPVVLYQPLGLTHLIEPEQQAIVQTFEEFRKVYQAGDFAQAAQMLEEYRKTSPNDGLVEVYAERLVGLINEPPTSWNGVYKHREK